ncbi:ligase-associated DNA damage response DEXH box helicase [soil metagenome]
MSAPPIMLDRFHLWFKNRKWKPFAFQEELLQLYFEGYSGLLNAPTGSGKTYALGLPLLLDALFKFQNGKVKRGIKAIWITPIRALAPEIEVSLRNAANELGLDWRIENRTGDTSAKDRAKQKKSPPEVLVTTPESIHVLMAQKGYADFFAGLECIIVDEWHELLSTKRGVQVELALSRLKSIAPGLRVWGISATIGNLDQAAEVLLGEDPPRFKIVTADIQKKLQMETILPNEIERYPWAGHLGLKLIQKIIPIIENSRSTLVFTNTRGQAEIWYQQLLAAHPDWAGQMALHHGSLSAETRVWVESALHEGRLKLVVCTSSLDLGVDFRPVETVIQIGSPKGVSRFAQRAGRSGHQPGAVSKIYLLPTNALELIEAAALKEALKEKLYESRIPVIRAFDVLIQYLVTLAVSDGFYPAQIFKEVKQTFCYQSINESEWSQLLAFITTGGETLRAYEEYAKVEIVDGLYKVNNKRIAMQHRLSIGTISSESSMMVSYRNGRRIGNIEEYFISRLKIGDVFSFSGKNLELLMIRGMQVFVQNTSKKSSMIPSWNGGRMPLSSQVSALLRKKLDLYVDGDITDIEMETLVPLLELQRERSAIPHEHELLIEKYHSKEGYHLLFYPFEGRLAHEGMAMLFAYRMTKLKPATFSISMNDYGFELLTDQPLDFDALINDDLFDTKNLSDDIFGSTNYTEIAKRRFRDIAAIAGLIFKGFPGKMQKTRHLQANSGLFYEVFNDYDKNNLLLKQALEEALYFQLEEMRLRKALNRMAAQDKLMMEIERPSPFSFPLLVDRMREKLSNESVEERVKKMIREMEAS